MGHAAELINTLFCIYAILRFQRSPQGAQWRSLWGRSGLLVSACSVGLQSQVGPTAVVVSISFSLPSFPANQRPDS